MSEPRYTRGMPNYPMSPVELTSVQMMAVLAVIMGFGSGFFLAMSSWAASANYPAWQGLRIGAIIAGLSAGMFLILQHFIIRHAKNETVLLSNDDDEPDPCSPATGENT